MRVFISHTANDPRDKDLARRLKEAIVDIGGETWIAPDNIPVGEHWQEHIVSAIIANSTHFLAVLSAAAVASEWVLKEVEMALQRRDLDPAYVVLLLPIGYLPPYRLVDRVKELQHVLYFEDAHQQAKALRECLRPKEAQSSTGAAIGAVADEVIAQIDSGEIRSIEQLETVSQALARRIRGRMISFCHFFKIGQGYALDSWTGSHDISQYIREFRQYTWEANERVGQRLSDFMGAERTRVCISEYSRAIFSGLKKRVKIQPPLEIIFVMRYDRAEVPEELIAARDYLSALGLPPANTLSVEDWISFLEEVKAGRQHIDAVLFGAEAVSSNGDVVFPQLIADEELDHLLDIAASGTGQTELVCVAESYKFLDAAAQGDVRKISNSALYRLLPSRLWSCFVTDEEVLYRSRDGVIDIRAPRRKVLRESRKILTRVRGEGMRPFSHMDDHHLERLEYLIADIDHTITTMNGKIPSFIIQGFEQLSQLQVKVILITGRSAGWSSALSVYLPGIDTVVCENGLIMIGPGGRLSILAGERLQQIASSQLETNAEHVADEFGLEPTDDSRFRLLERTFERPSSFGPDELRRCNDLVSQDLEVIASSIHIHVRPRGWDKADGVRAAMAAIELGHSYPSAAVVVGDSANDVPLFRDFAEVSVGVANVLDLIGELQGHVPRFVTKARYAEGFHEIITRILEAKHQQ